MLICFFLADFSALAQKSNTNLYGGLKFRNIGPAMTSGRIADIAIHPDNENVWYVAVGSGGVWKTKNSGTTWKAIFENQKVYSTGCITIDPNNPSTIWLGTGENVGGRHAGFGDGIYVSHNDGKSWKNMGLENSEHLSKIIVHPEDSDIIWVASQGPLWSKGGDRGVYTATWQRHRTVAGYLGGGPGSGLHKSTDGGETWKALKNGIPNSNLGKIGLAMSPFNSKVIYAAIELDRTKGGFYMSSNGGQTWVKQSDAVAGGTGPHYYQEIIASPHHEGTIYFMNNSALESKDHGKTFKRMKF